MKLRLKKKIKHLEISKTQINKLPITKLVRFPNKHRPKRDKQHSVSRLVQQEPGLRDATDRLLAPGEKKMREISHNSLD